MSEAQGFLATLTAGNSPTDVLSFAYCLMGGVGPAPIRAVYLKSQFDKLPPWDRANVVHAIRDLVRDDLTAAFDFHAKVARATQAALEAQAAATGDAP